MPPILSSLPHPLLSFPLLPSLFPPFSLSRLSLPLLRMSSLRDQVQKEDVKVKEKDIHASQKEGAHGYGGKYGVMKERQDKASTLLDCV